MANGIQPSGYFTTAPELGGGKGNTFQYLLDPNDPAGAYRAFLNSRLFPTDVGNYDNITSSGALASGPFNLIPTSEGMVTAAAGAVNPLAGIATRGAINRRNAEALETLAKAGILETITPAERSTGLTKFMGYDFKPNTGEYRLAPDVELAIQESGSTPQEYFESQFKSQYGQANELARYLDQIAYTTQGNFFTKDFFGNPTPWSKYVDRQGNIKPDALENWQKFGQKDKMGALAMFMGDDQGTQQSSSNQDSSRGGGIDTLSQGQVSEPRDTTPDFLKSSQAKRFDSKGRRLAGGTTNLLQG
mgnify:FL=1|jgi:hypothetical protein|tara:strand:+ start:62 stop:970 length:909 start_codon:yes stop_codon:yes gene_type:complete